MSFLLYLSGFPSLNIDDPCLFLVHTFDEIVAAYSGACTRLELESTVVVSPTSRHHPQAQPLQVTRGPKKFRLSSFNRALGTLLSTTTHSGMSKTHAQC